MKANHTEFCIYFKCRNRQEANTAESSLRAFAASKGHTISGVFCDRASDPPYSLLAFTELHDPHNRTVFIVPNADMISFGSVSAEAFAYHAGKLGIRFLMLDDGRARTEKHGIDKSTVKWLSCIKNYFGLGPKYAIRGDENADPAPAEPYKSRVPFGYLIRNGRVVINEAAAPVVCRMFSLFASGEGVADIERIILESYPEIKCPSRNQIYAIVSNRRYIGIDEKLPSFPAIIENRLWLACCSSAEKRGIKSKQYEFILPTVKYGTASMKRTEYNSTAHAPAYRSAKADCVTVIRACDLEQAVLENVCRVLPELLCSMSEKCFRALEDLRDREQSLSDLLRGRSELRLRTRDELSSEQIQSSLFGISSFDRLKAELMLFDIAIEHETFLVDLSKLSKEDVQTYVSHLLQLQELSRREIGFFLNALIKSIVVSDKAIGIDFKGFGMKHFELPDYVHIISKANPQAQRFHD